MLINKTLIKPLSVLWDLGQSYYKQKIDKYKRLKEKNEIKTRKFLIKSYIIKSCFIF